MYAEQVVREAGFAVPLLAVDTRVKPDVIVEAGTNADAKADAQG